MAPTASLTEPTPSDEFLAEATGSLRSLNAKALWRGPAPAAVRSAWKRSDADAAWRAWSEYLADREPLAAVVDPQAWRWGLPADIAQRFDAWQKQLSKTKAADSVRSQVGQWLGGEAAQPSIESALQATVLAEAAPRLAAVLGAEDWWRLVEGLRLLVDEAHAAAAPDPADAEGVVLDQLLTGELPLLLSRTLPEVRPLYQLADTSRESLSDALDRLADGEGLLTAALWIDEVVPAAALLLACWTRCKQFAGDRRPWASDAGLQYEWLVRQTLRMSDREGRMAFALEGLTSTDALLRAALEAGGDESDGSAAGERLRRYRADDSFEPPTPSNHSDWAELAVLAAGWNDKAPRIAVAYPGDRTRIEISAGKRRLLSGDWPIDVRIDGKPVTPADTWDCQCWYTDKDCDYLELAIELSTGATLERQIFLSRDDGVGFLADVLFSKRRQPVDLHLASRVPLAEGVSIRPQKETRDALLTVGGEPAAGLLPLALPEWRDDPRGGELSVVDRSLVLTRDRNGINVASHLWIDFAPRRFEKQRTWRQLAVAESLKNVSPDTAIAYRVQAAKHQWLVYRSLSPQPGNRTLLGQNFSSEAFVGRFDASDGTTQEYFEIEGSEA